MGLLIGMDEAGYGPNLGPLVITVTVWEVPGSPSEIDCWTVLKSVVSRPGERHDAERLLVGDSKEVYSPARGLGRLEESVLVLLSPLLSPPASFQALHQTLATETITLSDEPWYIEELAIPFSTEINPELVERWTQERSEEHTSELQSPC